MSEQVEAPVTPEPVQGEIPGVVEAAEEQRGNSNAAAEQAAELERLRKELEAAKPILAAHAEAEEARKSEAEKLREALDAAKAEAAEAARSLTLREVAEETGLSAASVAKLQGAGKDELLAAAKEIAAELSAKRGGGLPSRPQPNVKTGQGVPDAPEVTDPRKLAAAIRKQLSF